MVHEIRRFYYFYYSNIALQYKGYGVRPKV